MANPKSSQAVVADRDSNAMISDQQANVASLTDSSGGSADGTVAAISGSGADSDINNNFAELTTKVNNILTILEAHGLMADA